MREPADAAARRFAVDPRENVVLEASAGTGKTTVLVSRYLNLLTAGVDPANILAITFTRKAAAEMRERIVSSLRREADAHAEGRRRWRDLRDRLGDIAISTIDAFCLSLLREFPLEADLDPAFRVADDTEVARFVEDAIDRTLRTCQELSSRDNHVALALAILPTPSLREGLSYLLARRLVAPGAIARFLDSTPTATTADDACRLAGDDVVAAIAQAAGSLESFAADGPTGSPAFGLMVDGLRRATDHSGSARSLLELARGYFLTSDQKPRQRLGRVRAEDFASEDARRRHGRIVAAAAPAVARALERVDRNVNHAVVRGVSRIFQVALRYYRRALADQGVVDFGDALERAVGLLGQMDEFARSRYRLESRYHHVLVDEFQDTSRLQWQLVWHLVQSWGEGAGLVHDAPLPPSIFVVGDRKQSIYRFRDADVSMLREAASRIAALRPHGAPKRSISHSFRARPELLRFINDLFADLESRRDRSDGFTYDPSDRFPADDEDPGDARHVATDARLGVVGGETPADAARAVAAEVERLLRNATVRDRDSGHERPLRPGDVAILFRARESHRDFERALEARLIPAYVYKGLGFFETDEVNDLSALVGYLVAPDSPLATAAFLRSRFVRLSDAGLLALREVLPESLTAPTEPDACARLDAEDLAVLRLARDSVAGWLSLVDRLPPAELVDLVLADSAYAYELRGRRLPQARENLKKLRGLFRRLQNRGYVTLARMAAHLARLSAGDESNAVVDAVDAVNLMTVHAAKGLEFPVVFVVNIDRGTGGALRPVRVVTEAADREPSVAVGPFRSAADAEEQERDVEETKRLLYVALTRARERLYIGVPARGGGRRPGRGSLGEVLPGSFRQLLSAAAASSGPVAWQGRSGRTHVFTVCRPPDSDHVAGGEAGPESTGAPSIGAKPFAPWPGPVPAPSRMSVTEALGADRLDIARRAGGDRGEVLSGRLVHRLFQRALAPDVSLERAEEAAREVVRPSELAVAEDLERAVKRAARAFLDLRQQADVQGILKDASPLYEVPFSIRRGLVPPELASSLVADQTEVVHGVMDCLVRRGGRWTVLEFKTGRRAAWHAAQLAVYVAAVRHLVGSDQVDGVLAYPSGRHGARRPGPEGE